MEIQRAEQLIQSGGVHKRFMEERGEFLSWLGLKVSAECRNLPFLSALISLMYTSPSPTDRYPQVLFILLFILLLSPSLSPKSPGPYPLPLAWMHWVPNRFPCLSSFTQGDPLEGTGSSFVPKMCIRCLLHVREWAFS